MARACRNVHPKIDTPSHNKASRSITGCNHSCGYKVNSVNMCCSITKMCQKQKTETVMSCRSLSDSPTIPLQNDIIGVVMQRIRSSQTERVLLVTPVTTHWTSPNVANRVLTQGLTSNIHKLLGMQRLQVLQILAWDSLSMGYPDHFPILLLSRSLLSRADHFLIPRSVQYFCPWSSSGMKGMKRRRQMGAVH